MKNSSGYLSKKLWETNCSGVKVILSFSLNKPLALLKSGIPDSVDNNNVFTDFFIKLH